MATLQAADINDIAETTLTNLGRLKMTDVMTKYQNTIFLKRLVKQGKMKTESGEDCRFNIITATNGSARGVGLFYQANVGVPNIMSHGTMPWRHCHWNWSFDGREISMNAGDANKINDLMKTRRVAALGDGVVYFERRGWRCPAASNTDDFMGIPYWIVKNSTDALTDTTNEGFNGGAPSGYTQVGGITPSDPTVSPKWNNYTDIYVNITKEDFVLRLETMMDMTDFQPLLEGIESMPDYNTGDDYGLYTTRPVRQSCKALLEAQNENLGFDLDPTYDKLVFRRTRMTWVKELDGDTTGPVYAINWGVFGIKRLRDWWMRETVKSSLDNQPTVHVTYTDSSLNTFCTDRRRLGVIATGTGTLGN